MSLESFLRDVETKKEEEKEIKPSETMKQEPLVDWDGKDFRGEKCSPFAVNYLRQQPLVYKWLHRRPKNVIHKGCSALKLFTQATNITPDKFITLDKKSARDLVWEFIEPYSYRKAAAAKVYRGAISMFYFHHTEEKLAWIPKKHDIIVEPKVKERMTKEVCWRLINKTRNLEDETLLTVGFEGGLRRNAVLHLTYGHYKKFYWFKRIRNGLVEKSTETQGDIAIFRVVAIPSPDYTHDNKLRGKGIHWYFACLHKEATKILREYVARCHQKSTDQTPLFSGTPKRLLGLAKACARKAGFDDKKINFHALRRGFKGVVRNTATITDPEFKEAIQGHKLKGSQEAYFDKDPGEFAREYSKCDFSPSAELMQEKEKEIQELRERLEKFEHKPETNTENTENNDVATPKETDWYSQYQKDQKEQVTPEIKPMSMSISSQTSSEYFTCPETKQAHRYIELPCLKDIHHNCSNKECEKQVMDHIRRS